MKIKLNVPTTPRSVLARCSDYEETSANVSGGSMNPDLVLTPLESRNDDNSAWIRRLMGRFIDHGRSALRSRKQQPGRSRSINQDPLLEAALEDVASEVPVEKIHQVAHDVAYLRIGMVNVIFVGPPSAGDRQWVLIDTGLPGLTSRIEKAARQRFGKNSRPAVIVVTHGHFDHVGGLKELAQKWNVTIYAHPLEMPYLDGRSSYPALPVSDRSDISALSPLFQSCPPGVGAWLQPLPSDGSLPHMRGWEWIHTPGHAVGHVSLWRSSDRLLIAGDALITTDPESAYTIEPQKSGLHGPPMCFKTDRLAAHESMGALALLKPESVISGHGRVMQGAQMLAALESLADELILVDKAPLIGHKKASAPKN